MRIRSRQKLVGAIQYVPEGSDYALDACGSCAFPINPRVRVVARNSLRARIVDIKQVKAGWLARGETRQTHCQHCGAVYVQLLQYIPVECASFPCPRCGEGSKLTTEVLSITETEAGYSFDALLKCDTCSKQSRFFKLLQGLSKITRVKVGPTGVEVEVKP